MDDILFRLLIGHLFGDYIFQTSWMAEQKKNKTFPCVIHCLSYTFWVFVFVPELLSHPSWLVDFVFVGLVFLSHFILDRTQLVRAWWNKQSGKYYEEHPELLTEPPTVPIGVFVYITMDNTLHLFMMWVILKVLLGVAVG